MRKLLTMGVAVLLSATLLCACTSGLKSESESGSSGGYKYAGSNSRGDQMYHNSANGTNVYKNADGSFEVTDGYGTVLKDLDSDGYYDMGSIDGGKTWINLPLTDDYKWKK